MRGPVGRSWGGFRGLLGRLGPSGALSKNPLSKMGESMIWLHRTSSNLPGGIVGGFLGRLAHAHTPPPFRAPPTHCLGGAPRVEIHQFNFQTHPPTDGGIHWGMIWLLFLDTHPVANRRAPGECGRSGRPPYVLVDPLLARGASGRVFLILENTLVDRLPRGRVLIVFWIG